jgi:hypothetical protein
MPGKIEDAIIDAILPNNGNVRGIRALGFGKRFEEKRCTNWSFTQLRSDETLLPRLTRLTARLAAHDVHMKDVYAPTPEFETSFTHRARLSSRFPMGTAMLWRNPAAPGDIIELPKGGSVAFTTGGCGVAVAYDAERAYVAHVGRGNAIDLERVEIAAGLRRECGIRKRLNPTVFDALAEKLDKRTAHLRIFGALRPSAFPHSLQSEQYGALNSAIRNTYMYTPAARKAFPLIGKGVMGIDLPLLARWHALRLGMRMTCPRSSYLRKETAWLNGAKGAERNLLLIHWPA